MVVKIVGIVLVLNLLIPNSNSYNMDLLTIKPDLFLKEKISPLEVLNEIVEFETMRSSTFATNEGRVTDDQVNALCSKLVTDPDFKADSRSTKMVEMIPVQQIEGFVPQIFIQPCYAWIRKSVVGKPKAPFDYRKSILISNSSHFWVPFITHLDGVDCSPSRPSILETRRRKKRLAPVFEEIVIWGVEAATLCATRNIISSLDHANVEKLALPTNEAMQLRCANWKLTPDGWSKIRLSPSSCLVMNAHRPHGYVVNDDAGQDDDGFEDTIACGARSTLIDCVFIEHNVRDVNS